MFLVCPDYATSLTEQYLLPSPTQTVDQPLYDATYAPKKSVADFILFDERTPHITTYLVGGALASNLTNSTNVTVDAYNTQNSYYSNQNWNALFGIGVGVGYLVYPYPFQNFRITIDPAFYYANFGTMNGIEYPDSNGGSFDTLNYQYTGDSLALFLETHFTYTTYQWQPTFMVGLGVSRNTLSNYSEYATYSGGTASPTDYPFSNDTTTSFAYEIGIGVTHPIFIKSTPRVAYALGLEYRYMNFGSGELGASQAGDHLKVNTVDAQAILASLQMSFS